MISIEALKEAGLTNKVLKRIFTSKEPEERVKARKKSEKDARVTDPNAQTRTRSPVATIYNLESLPKNPSDWDIRCFLETQIRSRAAQGMIRCAANFDKWGAIDLAYSSIPIHRTTYPLMQVAMGYINLQQCVDSIGGLSEESKKDLFERDARGTVTGVRRPKLIEVSHNLVNSLTTRRVAAIATEVYQQYPVLKFDPYSNTQTSRLVADVTTQLAEQMAGAYGYRHDYEQTIRDASLYTDCVKFKASAWDRQWQILPVPKKRNGASEAGREEKTVFKRQLVKEGVRWTIPHPSRRYHDISQPLSKLNNDIGPEWIGHWDIVRIGSVRNNPAFFNTDTIAMDADMFSYFAANCGYFAQYYDCLTPPRLAVTRGSASLEALTNDRLAQLGTWAQLHDDVSTVLTQHYAKVIPKDIGIGTYEDPVWIRFVMAAQTTVVYAEIVGSTPASVNIYNGSDSLLVSPSFAMQAIQWQEMLTNRLRELEHVQFQGMVRIWALNTQGMKKNEVEAVENALKNPDYRALKDIVVKYDAEKLAQRSQDPRTMTDRIKEIRAETSNKVTEIFQSIVQTLALAERQMFFSPQELGQVSPRTTSATEQKAIRDTTLGIRDFHLVGVKEMMDADKRIIHDSYMAFGSEELETPVAERYDPAVITAAGFEIVDDGTGVPPDGLFTIKGKKLGLLYNYRYTTRNTDDTPPDATEAQALAQIYEVTIKDEKIRSLLTNAQRLELFNSMATRVSPMFQRINLPPGVDPNGRDGATIDQVAEAIPKIGQALEALSKQIQEQGQRLAVQDQSIDALSQALQKLTKSFVKSEVAAPSASPAAAAAGAPRRPRGVPQGQVGPDTRPGLGAPPLRAMQPRQPPLIGSAMPPVPAV